MLAFLPGCSNCKNSMTKEDKKKVDKNKSGNYPRCITWGIDAEFAAGAAHFTASVLPRCTLLEDTLQPQHCSHCSHNTAATTAADRSSIGLSLCAWHSCFAGFLCSWLLIPPSSQHILQSLLLAQAASDYFKPQPLSNMKNERTTLAWSISTY